MSDVGALLELLSGYHITDRALVRARDTARASGDAAAEAALRREMRRYFTAVERESRAQLTALDARLDDLYQRQYNLQAERSVTERRMLGARSVLGALGDGVREQAG